MSEKKEIPTWIEKAAAEIDDNVQPEPTEDGWWWGSMMFAKRIEDVIAKHAPADLAETCENCKRTTEHAYSDATTSKFTIGIGTIPPEFGEIKISTIKGEEIYAYYKNKDIDNLVRAAQEADEYLLKLGDPAMTSTRRSLRDALKPFQK